MKKFKVKNSFWKTWLSVVITITLLVVLLFLHSCGDRIPQQKHTGVIVNQLDNDTIVGRRDHVFVWYNYVVRETNNPELQLIRKTKGFYTIGDTLVYFRRIPPNK